MNSTIRRLISCVLSLILGLIAVSILTYNIADFSLNTFGSLADNGAVRNFAGMWGAYIGDAVVQVIGIAGIVPIILTMLKLWGLVPRVKGWVYAACILAITLCVAGVFSKLSLKLTSSYHHGGIIGTQFEAVPYTLLCAVIAASACAIVGRSLIVTIVKGKLLTIFRFRSVCNAFGRWCEYLSQGKMLMGMRALFLGFVRIRKWFGKPEKTVLQDSASEERRAEEFDEDLAGSDCIDLPDDEDLCGDEDLYDDEDTEGTSWDSLEPEDIETFAETKISHGKPNDYVSKNYDAHNVTYASDYGSLSEDNVCVTGSTGKSSLDRAFMLPDVALLSSGKESKVGCTKNVYDNKDETEELYSVLKDFGVHGKIINVCYGPVVTMYEFEPSAGTKASRIIGLADDIARSMCALSTRISVVPGRNVLGIELPNRHREIVVLRDIIESKEYSSSELKLPVILGKGIDGKPIVADLTKMPHLLIAGTTGSGKSVGINTMILSLLYSLSPEQCRMIMIDPKVLELSVYDNIPHLLTPVVTEAKKAVAVLKWVVAEMEKRYRLMSAIGVRNITGYNEKISKVACDGRMWGSALQKGENGFEKASIDQVILPYIVVIVDEMADLMIVSGKEIESSVQRLSQMARAAGIHIIMATQRPSVDVITGVIKANFPTRVSFSVTSKVDSRTILGEQGAEQLLGMGDMLYMVSGGKIERVHGAFVSDGEVQEVVNHLIKQREPDYIEDISMAVEKSVDYEDDVAYVGGSDELYEKAVSIVLRDKRVSVSYIQRQLRIGYNRASNLVERMEREGIVTPTDHLGRREIVVAAE